jgi:hypothetical protein
VVTDGTGVLQVGQRSAGAVKTVPQKQATFQLMRRQRAHVAV